MYSREWNSHDSFELKLIISFLNIGDISSYITRGRKINWNDKFVTRYL